MRRRALVAAAHIAVGALIASGCGHSTIRSGSGSGSGSDPYQLNQPLDDSTALAHARSLGHHYSAIADSAPGSVHHITVAQLAALDSRIAPPSQTGYTGNEDVVCAVVHAEWDVPATQNLPPGVTTPTTPPPYRVGQYMWCRTHAAPTNPADWRSLPSYGLVLPGNEVAKGW